MTATATCLDDAEFCDCFDLEAGFIADNGEEMCAGGRITGLADAPVYVVLGGISANRAVADFAGEPGWWACQVGEGASLDTNKVRILSLDFVADSAGAAPSTNDQARAILALADNAGVNRFSVIGSSYGGMVALALAAEAPERVEKTLVISAADRPSAMAQAWRSIQRETVKLALESGDGARGLDLARRLAMTTYRTTQEFEDRFFDPSPDCRDADGVSSYLCARGKAFTRTMTPERFLALSASMDAHCVDVSQIKSPVTYVAVEEDVLVPPSQIKNAAARTPNADLVEISSYYGHDAFLKEEAQIRTILATFAGA
ncbi:MAG: homoserine O-succinyltransferase [Alphaproteobacteria bacterium]|nr:homoserine O-succinyltransferase [Alphaproteobacteria bacterium]